MTGVSLEWQRDGVGAVYHGHALDVLRSLPDKSVHCCVTSPPYWGLRDYKTPPCVWGGDPDCDHEWGGVLPHGRRGNRGVSGTGGNLHPALDQAGAGAGAGAGDSGSFCQECGAWRGSLGLEPTIQLFVEHITEIFRDVRRVLRDDGNLWLNLGDSFAANRGYQVPDSKHINVGNNRGMKACDIGLKPKDMCGIPWRVAFSLQDDGWYLRSDIIWEKANPMPESVKDRPTKSHEYLFLLTKSKRYYYDYRAILEPAGSDTLPRRGRGRSAVHKFADGGPGNQTIAKDLSKCVSLPNRTALIESKKWDKRHAGYSKTGYRNKRSVWTVATKPFSGAHFATFPPKLIEPCILAGCPEGGVVLEPFLGSGVTAIVANYLGRQFVASELSKTYLDDFAIPRIKAATAQLELPLRFAVAG